MTAAPKPPANHAQGVRTPSQVIREQEEAAEAQKQALLKVYPSHKFGTNRAFTGPTKKG